MPSSRLSMPSSRLSMPSSRLSMPSSRLSIPSSRLSMPSSRLSIPPNRLSMLPSRSAMSASVGSFSVAIRLPFYCAYHHSSRGQSYRELFLWLRVSVSSAAFVRSRSWHRLWLAPKADHCFRSRFPGANANSASHSPLLFPLNSSWGF